MARKKQEAKEKVKGKAIIDLTPEECDNIIKAELASILGKRPTPPNCPTQKHSWSEYAVAVRQMVILDLMAQGLSYYRIVHEIMKRWGVARPTGYKYVKDCADYLGKQFAEFAENNYEVALHRVEAVAEDAIARNDNKTALKAFDMINRLQGLYEEKVKVEADATIEFKFGGE